MINGRSRVLVLGSNTFLGTALLRRLRAKTVGLLSAPGEKENQLLDRAWVADRLAVVKPDVLFLAGGPSGGILENQRKPGDLLTVNLAMELNVLQLARRSRARRVVYFGSSCMYPREAAQPMKESALWGGPLEPTSRAYAVAKLTGLEMGLAFDRQDGTRRFLALIPNSMYGPGDNFDESAGHVVASMIRRFHEAKMKKRGSLRLWGTGSPRREFIHIDDVADAAVHLGSVPPGRFLSPVNVGVGKDGSIAELAAQVKRVVGFEGKMVWDPSKPEGAPRKWLDSQRLFETGWKPHISLEKGLRETYRFFRTHVAPS